MPDAPDDAYDRVTNPERYLPLRDVAQRQIDRLVGAHRVERIDGCDVDPRMVDVWPGSPATGVMPLDGGAPLIFTFTPFPGVMVSFGHNGLQGFPSCGCDACDDDPDDEIERMVELVTDVVARGLTERRFRESRRRERYECELRNEVGSTRLAHLYDADRDRPVPLTTTRWPAWTPTG